MRLNRIYLLLTMMFLFSGVFGQRYEGEINSFNVLITQQILPYSSWNFTYQLTPNRIEIYKTKDLNQPLKHRKKRIYKMKIDSSQLDSIRNILKEVNVFELGESYSSGWIDGVNWTFEFYFENKNKVVQLDNYCLPQMARILDYINLQLPEGRRYISFDIFDTRNKK